ncbi:MAG: molecular chaperone GrpE [Actinomycetota bacterium]|nr:molecular chaperone GrpE [Actinomycetota bacterium]
MSNPNRGDSRVDETAPPTTGKTATPDPATPDSTGPDPMAAPSEGGAGAGGLGDELAEAVMSDLDVLAAERDAYYDQLLRTRADFDNFRKRMIKQQTEHLERANETLIVKLLDVLDVLDGARAHGEGFEQVGASLAAALEKEGLERIEPFGQEFDPNEADAVAHEPAAPGEGLGGQLVSAVLRPGYRWKGRVVRPAMVKVRG